METTQPDTPPTPSTAPATSASPVSDALQTTRLDGWTIERDPRGPESWVIEEPTGRCHLAADDPAGNETGRVLARLCALLASRFAGNTGSTAASRAVNLEGLRRKLLTPRNILRDENGWLWHPDYPVCDEGTRADRFLEAFGIEPAFVSMESDNPDFAERWHEEGLTDCSAWTPTPPAGDGWLLLEVYDTEDGPCAMFGRDRYEAQNALKRQRTRQLREQVAQPATSQGEPQ
jgi:hypothetical protein